MTYPEDIMQAAREAVNKAPEMWRLLSTGQYCVKDIEKDERLQVALYAIAAERARHQWQPIETAPKDSVGVIAWIGSPAYGYAVTAWQEKEGEWRTPIGKDGYMKIPWPILWMPLPQPPQEASK